MREFPISTKSLESYLPHRPPMVWIDEVTKCDEQGGEARVVLKSDAMYMNEDGSFRPSAVIELIAQTCGFVAACFNSGLGAAGLKNAFLVGIRDAKLDRVTGHPELRAGASLLIRVGNLKQIGAMQIVDGWVTLEPTGAAIAEANLKLFSEPAT